MAGGGVSDGTQYSTFAGLVFTFNLIVGTGAITLPKMFEKAGVWLGSLLLTGVCFVAFISLTFIIESLSTANAMLAHQAARKAALHDDAFHQHKPMVSGREQQAVVINKARHAQQGNDDFEIRERVELGHMAQLFMGKRGYLAFYACMVIYLVGDLAIYAAFVPDSLAQFIGPFSIGSWHLTADVSYRFFVLLFACMVCPFCFMDFSNTKVMQFGTMAIRNSAFLTMIVLGVIRMSGSDGSSVRDVMSSSFRFAGFPSLFGGAVYSFMCHHTLPSIITPIRNKARLKSLFAWNYVLILVAYLALCWSAVFAFESLEGKKGFEKCVKGTDRPCELQATYTFNFTSYHVEFFADFLTLFPVFTLTTNYPMIAITLRNNMQNLFRELFPRRQHSAAEGAPLLDPTEPNSSPNALLSASPLPARSGWRSLLARHGFSALACFPPIVIALAERNVGVLVDYTGSFAGIFIQYVIPALLVLYSRQWAREQGTLHRNTQRSPFRSRGWIWLVIGWAAVSLVIQIFNHVCNLVPSCHVV